MNAILLIVFSLFSLVAFGGILWGADPYASGALIKVMFFITLFFSAAGVFSLASIFVSRIIQKPVSFNTAFRRGLLLAMLIVAIVALETGKILNIGNVFAVFMLVAALEMLAVARGTHVTRHAYRQAGNT